MADALFEDPRLADVYDLLEPKRPDLRAYLAMVLDLGGRRVLDVGCGTGTFACLLAQHDIEVTGVDPAAASLDVALRKPFADKVTWVLGDGASVPRISADLVTMTGNVAQVFLGDEEWSSTLRAARAALGSGGRLVFEVRDPDKEGWRQWTRERTYRNLRLPGLGPIETWTEVTDVATPFVSFRHHFVFGRDETTLVSDSTLRFRGHTEVADSLEEAGFGIEDVRDAPDRPGLELVFIASRSSQGASTARPRCRRRSPSR